MDEALRREASGMGTHGPSVEVREVDESLPPLVWIARGDPAPRYAGLEALDEAAVLHQQGRGPERVRLDGRESEVFARHRDQAAGVAVQPPQLRIGHRAEMDNVRRLLRPQGGA